MMSLLLWEANESLMPKDREERIKLVMSLTEQTKKSLDSGETKMWGISTAGGRGFSVTEGDGKETFARLQAYAPYIRFKVKPMLSFDEFMEVMKEM